MSRAESVKKAQRAYRMKFKDFHILLDMDKDADIIEWVKEQASATASIKSLIRANISRKRKG